MADQTQPWAERTVELPPQQPGFQRGVASVTPRTGPVADERFGPLETTREAPEGGWPELPGPAPRPPFAYQLRQLRRGGGWTVMGGLFAFICWGVWAISARGDLTSPVVTFLLSLAVAVGIFALSRLLGRVVLEGRLGRVRRTAAASHVTTAVFLVGVGIAYLRQTEWVISVWNWLANLW